MQLVMKRKWSNSDEGTICCHIKEPQFGVSDVVTMHHTNEACTIHNEDPVNE